MSDIDTFDGISRIASLNGPLKFFSTPSQPLLPTQPQFSHEMQSQHLPELLGLQQSQPFPTSHSHITQQLTELTVPNPQLVHSLPNNNRNNASGGHLDHVVLTLNDINKNLSEILNDFGILAGRLNNEIQSINAIVAKNIGISNND
nr:10707_t:CDS:2 [Entrophospora candida]